MAAQLSAETFVWTGEDDGENLFGSGFFSGGYLGNWSPNLTADSFPVLGDFVVNADENFWQDTLFIAEDRTLRSLVFAGDGFSVPLALNNTDGSGIGTRTISFGEADTTILSLATTTASTVIFGVDTALNLAYSGLGTIHVSGSNNLRLGSASIGGTGGFIKTGTGTLTLGVENSFAGKMQVLEGTLEVGATNQFGALPGSVMADAVTINGGTLHATGGVNSGTNRGFQIGANGGNFSVAEGVTMEINGVIGDVAGESGTLVKTGAGILYSVANNTFTGGLRIEEGVFQASWMNRLGATPEAYKADAVVINGGTLRFVSGVGTANTSSGTARGFQVGSDIGTIEVTGSLTRSIISIVSDVDGQAGILRKTGTGILELTRGATAGNTFSGGLWIEEGTVVVGSVNNLGSTAANDSAVIINGGILYFGSTSYNAYSVATRGFRVGSNVGTMTVGDGLSRRIHGNIADMDGQAGVLRKAGTGTLSLQGAITHTGGTLVNDGTLRLLSTTLGGVGGAGLSVVAESGATAAVFDGNGVVNGDSSFGAGGVLRMTTYITTGTTGQTVSSQFGTLQFTGNLDISGAAASEVPSFYFDLGLVGSSDMVSLSSGALSIGSGLLGFSDFSFTTQTGFGEGIYTLFSTTQSLVGTLLASDVTGTVGGYDVRLAVNEGGNSIDLLVGSHAAIPEPAAWAGIMGGLALGAVLTRRRDRR